MASARVVNRVVNTKILLPLEFITETGHLLRRKKSGNEKLISFFFALAQMTFLSRHRQFFYSLASHHARRSFFHRRLIEIFICKDLLLLPSDKSSIFCLHYKCFTVEGGRGIIHGPAAGMFEECKYCRKTFEYLNNFARSGILSQK